MEIKRLELLERATAVFLKYGIKSVTMDDMARELVVSKKTLYQHFKDKNDLVEAIIKAKTTHDEVECKHVKIESENAIEELFKIGVFVSNMMKNIHPSVFFDLKKFHPTAWKMISDHKWKFVKQTILENIIRGKKEGVYRAELNEEVIAIMYVGATDLISNGEAFADTNLSSDKLFIEIITFQIHGMASEKGLKYLNNILKNEK